ncbi:Conserved_hypothetical protein [Hexamita inflata]|uniref:RNA helicase n=1 Tax=Hexamita inflata TaxID=28002 RepID=A0AA86Q8G7_9EUKA|nr:Conserved hypothetical protein [Hexamita inflata]
MKPNPPAQPVPDQKAEDAPNIKFNLKQLLVYGLPDEGPEALFKQLTNLTPTISDPIDGNPPYRVLTFNNENDADTAFELFGSQTQVSMQKYQNANKMKIVSAPEAFKIKIYLENLVVLIPEIDQPLKNSLRMLKNYVKTFQFNEISFKRKLIQQNMFDILKLIGQIDQNEIEILWERFQNILNYSDQNENLKLINTFLNSFSNAVIQRQDVKLEVRLFSFGRTTLPLPIYQLRNRILQGHGSPIIIIKSSNGSGKSLLFPIFIMQLHQIKGQSDNKRIYITQPSIQHALQTKQTLQEKILDNTYTVSTTPTDTNANICICTPFQLTKVISQNPAIIEESVFILDDFHTRTIALDILFVQIMTNRQKLTEPFQFIMMSSTPDLDIIKQIPQQNHKDVIIEVQSKKEVEITETTIKASNTKEIVEIQSKIAAEYINNIILTSKPHGDILCIAYDSNDQGELFYKFVETIKNNQQLALIDLQQINNQEQNNAIQQIQKQCQSNTQKLYIIPIFWQGQINSVENVILTQFPNELKSRCIKVLFTTDSLYNTIRCDDLICVITPCVIKELQWNDTKGMKSYVTKKMSESEKIQRKYRLGKIQHGFVFFIDVESVKQQQQPEIQRADLKRTILELLDINLNIKNIIDKLPTQPNFQQIDQAMLLLTQIDAVKVDQKNDCKITELGTRLLQYTDIDIIIGYVVDNILYEDGKESILVAIITICLLLEQNKLILNNYSPVVKKCFMKESDAVTIVKCFLDIESQVQQEQYCQDNQLSYEVFTKVRNHVQYIYTNIIKANKFQISEGKDYFHQQLNKIQEINVINNLNKFQQYLSKTRNKIDKNSADKYHGVFQQISNVSSIPKYNYLSQYYLNNQLIAYIQCFERYGIEQLSAYNKVYFFDISFDEDKNIYNGKFMHSIENSFDVCNHVQITQNAIKLPYTEFLIQSVFKNLYEQFKITPMAQYSISEDQQIYFVESFDKQNLTYTTNQKINKELQDQINKTIQKIIEISANCPTSLISRYPGLKDYYIEFYQTDNKCDAKFIRKSQDNEHIGPFAYTLNDKSINQLMQIDSTQFRIAYVFDLKDQNFNSNKYQCDLNYNGDNVWIISNNSIQNQLVIISENKIQQLKQLKWDNQNIQQFAYDINSRKLQDLKKKQIPGVSVVHYQNELLIQPKLIYINDIEQKTVFNVFQENLKNLNVKISENQKIHNIRGSKIENKDQIEKEVKQIVQITQQFSCQDINGLLSVLIPQKCWEIFNECDQNGPTIIKKNNFKWAGYYYNYIIHFVIENIYKNQNFETIIMQVIDQFGMFVQQYKYNGQQFVIDIRTIEAGTSMLNVLEEKLIGKTLTIPYHIIPKDLQDNPLIIEDIKNLLNNTYKTQKVQVTKEGTLEGDQKQMLNILSDLKIGIIKLNLSLQEIPFYNVPKIKIEKMKYQFKNENIKINSAGNKLIVPTSLHKQIYKQIQNLIEENNQNNVICFGLCEYCNPSNFSIVSKEQNKLKCLFYCQQCILDQLKNQVSSPEIMIKIGEGEDNLGKFISFFQDNEEIREYAFQILTKTGEMAAHHSQHFKFCPICNKVADKCGEPGQDTLLYNCQQCNHKWCTDCGDWHKPGQKCAGLGNNKRCPGCKSITEKTDGCNRISCPCGTHWCWVCGTFAGKTAQQVYDHLNQAHGGYW